MSIMDKSRKRQLEVEDDYGEGNDTFDLDDAGDSRRARKAMRRVSGVYREIKSLQSIGSNASVMELVFERLCLKDVMAAGCNSSMWYITACHELRKRYGDSPILRLWTSNKPWRYPDIEWELHFHQQILEGTEEMDTDTTKISKQFPPIDTIISIGNRYSYEQFINEDAKLPFRQDYIFLTCGEAIITTPDFSYTGIVEEKFGLDMVIQSFLIPKSEKIALKAFTMGVERYKPEEEQQHDTDLWKEWTPEQVKSKVEFPVEDVGEGLDLRAVLCVHYHPQGPTTGFVKHFKSAYANVGLLSGIAEEIGSNRYGGIGSPWAVGLSLYAGQSATVEVYQIDFEGENSEKVLLKMQDQAKSHRHGFCLVFSHDSRPSIEILDEERNEKEDWSYSYPQPSKVQEIIGDLRKRMPRTPVFGISSLECSIAAVTDPKNSNIDQNSKRCLCYGFLVVSYD